MRALIPAGSYGLSPLGLCLHMGSSGSDGYTELAEDQLRRIGFNFTHTWTHPVTKAELATRRAGARRFTGIVCLFRALKCEVKTW